MQSQNAFEFTSFLKRATSSFNNRTLLLLMPPLLKLVLDSETAIAPWLCSVSFYLFHQCYLWYKNLGVFLFLCGIAKREDRGIWRKLLLVLIFERTWECKNGIVGLRVCILLGLESWGSGGWGCLAVERPFSNLNWTTLCVYQVLIWAALC